MAEELKDKFGRVFALKAADELLQEDVELWNRTYVQLRAVGLAEQRGAQLRAGIVAKWITSPETAVEERVDLETGRRWKVYLLDGVDVAKMRPAEVSYYGRQCERLFGEVTTVEDEKN